MPQLERFEWQEYSRPADDRPARLRLAGRLRLKADDPQARTGQDHTAMIYEVCTPEGCTGYLIAHRGAYYPLVFTQLDAARRRARRVILRVLARGRVP